MTAAITLSYVVTIDQDVGLAQRALYVRAINRLMVLCILAVTNIHYGHECTGGIGKGSICGYLMKLLL